VRVIATVAGAAISRLRAATSRLRAAAFGLGAAALGLCALESIAYAAQIRTLDIDRESGRYSLYADTFLQAPPGEIFDVLLDYDRFNRISSVYKEFGYLDPAPDGTPIVFTRMEGCLLKIYCLSMRRVERLEADKPGHIRTVTLPEQSDFRYSVSEWTLEPEGAGTRVIYELEMEPDFWVPPIIGPWYLKRILRRGGTVAITRIERLASAAAGGGVNADTDGIDLRAGRSDARSGRSKPAAADNGTDQASGKARHTSEHGE
jgi:hypothetical protein